MKRQIAVLLIVVANLIALVAMVVTIRSQNKTIERLNSNVEAIAKGPSVSEDSSRIEVQQLSMKVDEINRAFPALKAELKSDFGVKMKNLESYTRSQMEVNARITASVVDSIRGRDTLLVQRFKDKFIQYISVSKPMGDSAKVSILLPVELQQIAAWYRPRGFPFGWGWFNKKRLKQTIRTDNPYVKLTYSEFINVDR